MSSRTIIFTQNSHIFAPSAYTAPKPKSIADIRKKAYFMKCTEKYVLCEVAAASLLPVMLHTAAKSPLSPSFHGQKPSTEQAILER